MKPLLERHGIRRAQDERFVRMRQIFGNSRNPPADPPPASPPDSLTVSYHIRIAGNGETVVDLASGFEIPMALRRDFIATADGNFPELFERLVAKPLATAVSGFLSHRFEELNRPEPRDQHSEPQHAIKPDIQFPESLQDIIGKQDSPKP